MPHEIDDTAAASAEIDRLNRISKEQGDSFSIDPENGEAQPDSSLAAAVASEGVAHEGGGEAVTEGGAEAAEGEAMSQSEGLGGNAVGGGHNDAVTASNEAEPNADVAAAAVEEQPLPHADTGAVDTEELVPLTEIPVDDDSLTPRNSDTNGALANASEIAAPVPGGETVVPADDATSNSGGASSADTQVQPHNQNASTAIVVAEPEVEKNPLAEASLAAIAAAREAAPNVRFWILTAHFLHCQSHFFAVEHADETHRSEKTAKVFESNEILFAGEKFLQLQLSTALQAGKVSRRQSSIAENKVEVSLFSSDLFELLGRNELRVTGRIVDNLLSRAVHYGHLRFGKQELTDASSADGGGGNAGDFDSVAALVQYRVCLAGAEDVDTAEHSAMAMPIARITLHDVSIQPGKFDLSDIESVRVQFTTGHGQDTDGITRAFSFERRPAGQLHWNTRMAVTTPEPHGPLKFEVLMHLHGEALERAESFSLDLADFNFQQQYVLDLWTNERSARVCISLERLESLDAQLNHLTDDETQARDEAIAGKKDPDAAAAATIQTLRLRLMSLHKKKKPKDDNDKRAPDARGWNSSTHVPKPKDAFLEDEEARELEAMRKAAETKIRARNMWVVAHLLTLQQMDEAVARVGHFGQHKVHVPALLPDGSPPNMQPTAVSVKRANELSQHEGELPLHVFQHHSAKDKFTPRLERDAKFFFNSSSLRKAGGRYKSSSPGLGVVFEVYHRNLKHWSRENDDATLHGTVEDRAASGFDHHLEFVGYSTYVLPSGMVTGKRYTAPFEELVVADAANPIDGNGKAYSHSVNTSPAVVEYAQQLRVTLSLGSVLTERQHLLDDESLVLDVCSQPPPMDYHPSADTLARYEFKLNPEELARREEEEAQRRAKEEAEAAARQAEEDARRAEELAAKKAADAAAAAEADRLAKEEVAAQRRREQEELRASLPPGVEVELTDQELEELREALHTEDPTQVMRRLGVSPVDMPKAWDPSEGAWRGLDGALVQDGPPTEDTIGIIPVLDFAQERDLASVPVLLAWDFSATALVEALPEAPKPPSDGRYEELRNEIARLRKELKSRKSETKKLRKAVRGREDAIRQCGTEIVLLRKEKQRLSIENDRLIQTLQNRDRAEERAIDQAERNPDGISHCEAVQLSILAQEKFRQQSVQNAKLVKKVQSMLKDVARSKKLKKDHQKLAEAHEAAQKYILRLQKTANHVKVLESTAVTQSRVIEKLQQLLQQKVLAASGTDRPSPAPQRSKWDIQNLMSKLKKYSLREKFMKAVQDAIQSAKADPESLNASPQDQEYIHQLEEEMSRLRLGQGLTEDRIAEASAEGGESAGMMARIEVLEEQLKDNAKTYAGEISALTFRLIAHGVSEVSDDEVDDEEDNNQAAVQEGGDDDDAADAGGGDSDGDEDGGDDGDDDEVDDDDDDDENDDDGDDDDDDEDADTE